MFSQIDATRALGTDTTFAFPPDSTSAMLSGGTFVMMLTSPVWIAASRADASGIVLNTTSFTFAAPRK